MNNQKIKAVILIGPLDFGRCRLASMLSVSMWPMIDRPVVRSLVEQLGCQGIKDITICSKDYVKNLENVFGGFDGFNINIIVDELPAGTAGSIRSACEKDSDETLLILPASVAVLPDIEKMIEYHNEKSSDLTIAFNRPDDTRLELGGCSEIYLCKSDILEYIPQDGYCDIKEILIPKLVKNKKKVYPYILDNKAGIFRNISDYLEAVSLYLSSDLLKNNYGHLNSSDRFGADVLIADETEIDDSVKIYGPAVIFENVIIEKNSVIVGPVVIGENTFIGPECLIADSFLWQGSGVSARSRLNNSVLAYDTQVLSDTTKQYSCITPKSKKVLLKNHYNAD